MSSHHRDTESPLLDVASFQQLADGAPIMIWMSGRDMGCFYFNRSWLDFRGRTLEQEFGNGWAEGVHPDDLQRCVQHYVTSFERRVPFAMSYRLLHHSGDFRWILDRGAPHYDVEGTFLGFYGGCAETSSEDSVSRIKDLRQILQQMQKSAEELAVQEAFLLRALPKTESLEKTALRLEFQHKIRHHAAVEISRLASDMLRYDRIDNGACLR